MRPVRAVGLLFALSALVAVLACAADRRPTAREDGEDAQAGKKDSDKKADAKGAGFADLGDLNAEVTVLQVLTALGATPEQLERLATLAAKTMQKPPPRKLVKVTEKYRKGLRALRDALVKGDEEQIDAALEAMEELSKKEMPDFDDVELTDAARKSAPALLRRFSARQVSRYLATLAEVPDPAEQLEAAMKRSRELRGRAWQDERDAASVQVGWLIAGVDAAAEKKAREKAEVLLNRAHRMEDKEYAAKQSALRKEARELVGKLGPTDVLRNFMERVLAETLSSYRLTAALDARAKKK